MSERPFVPLDAFTRPRDHSSRVVPLWVNDSPPYELTLSHHTLPFGNSQVNVPSDPLVLKVVNTGFQPLTVESVTVTGEAFSIPVGSPVVLDGGGGRLLVPVTFRPPVYGVHYGELVITTKEGIVKKVRLIGAGVWDYVNQVDGAITSLWEFLKRATRPALTNNGPVIDLGNTGVEFKGELVVGEETSDFDYVIANAGNQPLVIDQLTITGDFEIIP